MLLAEDRARHGWWSIYRIDGSFEDEEQGLVEWCNACVGQRGRDYILNEEDGRFHARKEAHAVMFMLAWRDRL